MHLFETLFPAVLFAPSLKGKCGSDFWVGGLNPKSEPNPKVIFLA